MGPLINGPDDISDADFLRVRQEIKKMFGSGEMMIALPRTNIQVIRRPVIQFVAAEEGDWIACYIDGVEVDQGHSLYVVHLLQTLSDQLGIVVPDTIYYDADQIDQLGGNFPERMEDIDGILEQM
jgi:hypothetical protein